MDVLKRIGLYSVLALAIYLFNNYGWGATTGNITISGVVPAATAIVVTTSSGYNNLNLAMTATNQVVAQVREINNTLNGYYVTLSSVNNGLLKNGLLGQRAYTARYNGTSATLSSTPVTITTQGSQTSVVNVLKNFDISYIGSNSEDDMQGTYNDILTFTIQGN